MLRTSFCFFGISPNGVFVIVYVCYNESGKEKVLLRRPSGYVENEKVMIHTDTTVIIVFSVSTSSIK